MPRLPVQITIGELSARSGVPTSALRFYEAQGLISSVRTSGNQRRFRRHTLRRVAFIRTAQRVGLSLDEIKTALDTLPDQRTPTKADWARLSREWEPRLNEPKDSGVLYYSVGEFGTDYWHSWMEAQEFQMIEGGIGDYWTIANAQVDIRASKPEGAKFYKFSRDGEWLHFAAEKPGRKAVANYCQAGENKEIPNAWNQIDLVCFKGSCVQIENGTVVMAVKNSSHEVDGKLVPLVRGKIQLQSESAEVYYKDIQVQTISEMPKQYLEYFK